MSPEKLSITLVEQEENNQEHARSQFKRLGERALDGTAKEKDDFEMVPEGYLTTSVFAKILRINVDTVERKVQELGIEKTKYKSEIGRLNEFLSPEQQQQITDSLEHLISAEKAPEDYLTIGAFAKKIGIKVNTVERKVQELGIEKTSFKHKSGHLYEFLSPEQQQQIIDSLDHIISAEIVPEGYLTTKAFAIKFGIGERVVANKIQELGIEKTKYKSETGQLREFLSPEQQQQIIDSLDHIISAEKVPDGYLTTNAFAKKIGIKVDTIERKVKELGIKRTKYKSEAGQLCEFLSSEQQKRIIESLDYLISAEKAPEGYLVTKAFAIKIGVSEPIVESKIQELKIERAKYKNEFGQLCGFLSPGQQQQIADSLEYLISAEKAPEGYLTINAFAKKLGISGAVVEDKVRELRIEKYKYKDNTGNLREFLSPEQQQQIANSLEYLVFAEKAPEGYLTIKIFAKKLGVSEFTVVNKIQELRIERAKYKNKIGQLREFLSPEQQQQIIDSLDHIISAEKVPDGYLTVTVFAEKIGIDKKIILNKIQELRIERAKYKNTTGHLYEFLSPEQQQQIADSLEHLISAEKAPEGYIVANTLAKKNGISVATIEKKIQELGIKRAKYKNETGQLREFLSPEQQQQIVDSLDYIISAEKVPEGYLAANVFAKEIGIDVDIIENKIQELGIKRAKYKNERGQIWEFLSPEQQSDILENLESISSGTSIPENAVAFYFLKANQSIEQGRWPDWLKNPETKRNLQIDIFVDPPGIGIEYDGWYWHQDVERDIKKDNIAQKNGYRIIHIREDGCPEMPEGSICIKRNNNNDDSDLGECIKKCFEMLNIPIPDIDVTRDKGGILALRQKNARGPLDSAKALNELRSPFRS